MRKITVAKRNGLEEIHKPNCKDLKRTNHKWASDRDDWSMEVENLGDLYANYWDCIAEESVGNGDYATVEEAWWAWRGEFRLMPCAGQIDEMPEPGSATETASEPNGKRTRNQELARQLVEMVTVQFAGASDDEKAKLAYWLHSLPTGGKGAERYWPANFPRPETADWK